MHKNLANVLLVFFSVAITLLLCEGMFYYLNTLSPRIEIESVESMPNAERLDFFQYHPVFGFAGIPNIRKEFYGKYITHNSKGLRGSEVETQKADGMVRLLFIGDSQTWGFGVSDNETIPQLSHKLLSEKIRSSGFEVLNFGTSGYGIGQSYLRLITDGLQYQPDYIVFTYFADNDIWETATTNAWGVEKPLFFKKEDGGLCVSNIPPKRASGWPSDNMGAIIENKFNITASQFRFSLFGADFDLNKTQTFTYFKNRGLNTALLNTWGIDNDDPFAATRKHIGCMQKEAAPILHNGQDQLELALKLIQLMHQTSQEVDAKFIVVTKPNDGEYRTGQPNRDYRTVLKKLEQLGVNTIDLYSKGKQAGMTADQLFIEFGHLSVAGNQLVADNLAEIIAPQQQTILKTPAVTSE